MFRILLLVVGILFAINPIQALELRYISGDGLTAAGSARPPVDDPQALPDAVLAMGTGAVRSAWLVFPTTRYDHAILGDGIEAEGVRIELASGQRQTFRLPEDSVFEDRYPRLVDLDGDGVDEIVLVRSYLDRGAALAVLKTTLDGLKILAESDPIGLPHRWMNPVGTGDFDRDGIIELAAVVTPHIGGILTIYKRQGGRLVPVHRMSGFSNHRIGSLILGQSAVVDLNGDGTPDLAVPAPGFHELRLISLTNGTLKEIKKLAHSSPIVTALLVVDLDGDGDQDLRYGLADGRQVELLLP
ncbi:FG-GAP and VCBS repeat-containing protein [Sedimenticola selenatireducens]|uniref:FG-GAP and VCBS repeat-containing protein n=1 Tax=Sedimenticola selenatireducens TaxID=191960 RepID=UPI0004B6A1F7|nr:FG-GAP and VCBS repeat-containing protein [Sedimenticola selenatireducens]